MAEIKKIHIYKRLAPGPQTCFGDQSYANTWMLCNVDPRNRSFEIWAVLFMALYFAFSVVLAQKCSRVCGLWLNHKLFPGFILCKIHFTISPWCVNTLKMWKVNFLLSCFHFQKIYTETCRPGNQPFETTSRVMQHLQSKWQHSQEETEWRRKPKLPGWPGAPAASPRPKCGSPNFLGPIWSWCWVY